MSWGVNQVRRTIVLHDTDIHGWSCGINALYALRSAGIDADVFSHFSTNPNEPATTPAALASVVENLGMADLYILDIPVDIRNPKRYIDALVSHARYKGRVVWMDHHGHSQWIDELNRNGVFAVVYGTSYELSLAVPRMFGRVDKFVEEWALVGSIADFDVSIADKVSTDLEVLVAEYLDPVFKFNRNGLASMLGIAHYLDMGKGNVGGLTLGIVERGIEASRVLEVARSIAQPLPQLPYRVVGDVVYTTQMPPQGLSWKMAWKLCVLTGAKVAIVPAFNPRTQQYAIIIAKYWRAPPEIVSIIEEYVQRRFAGRQIVGHPGARSIALMSQNELDMIPTIARELNEMISSRMYTPSTVRLINETVVARALHEDFKAIMQKLAEILEAQQRMYQEYLELKRRQVELLERASGSSATRYD